MMSLIAKSEADIPQIIPELWNASKEFRVIFLVGDLGAGKTTLIKYLAKYLQFQDDVSSPTFSIVNEYRSADEHSFFHFDLYRIEMQEELLEIGFDDYLDKGTMLIEWPQIALDLINDPTIIWRLDRKGDQLTIEIEEWT